MDYLETKLKDNKELGDSECMEDELVPSVNNMYQKGLLDLSDDVLLYILRLCSPRDLKALGHSCPRLGALICDHTLWTKVDLSDQSTGQERMRWLLDYCLSPSTHELKLKGYVDVNNTCLGIQDLHKVGGGEYGRDHCMMGSWLNHLPRFAMSPRWPDKSEAVFKLCNSRKAPRKFSISRLKRRSEAFLAQPICNTRNARVSAQNSTNTATSSIKISSFNNTTTNSTGSHPEASSTTAASSNTVPSAEINLNDCKSSNQNENHSNNETKSCNSSTLNLNQSLKPNVAAADPSEADASPISVSCSSNVASNSDNLSVLKKSCVPVISCSSVSTVASSSNSAPASNNAATSSISASSTVQCDMPGYVTFRSNNSVSKNLTSRDNSTADLPTVTFSQIDSKLDCIKGTRGKSKSASKSLRTSRCPGPQFTFNENLLKDFKNKCCNLTSLTLEYCNMDYKTTNLQNFPSTLKRLSLKGTMCYNLPFNTSFLRKIQDILPALEFLDISECNWFEPSSLMSLSKLPNLEELHMKNCRRLTECVAYASLATRYGFLKLKILDVRGSMVADSEVSAFGWLPLLEELYVSSPKRWITFSEHSHKWEDMLAPFVELEPWEIEAPYYYRCKSPSSQEFMKEDEGIWEGETQNGCTESQDKFREIAFGNYIDSLESRIIVIQPNWNRNQTENVEPAVRPEEVRDVLNQFQQQVLQQQNQEQGPSARSPGSQEPAAGCSNGPREATSTADDKTQSGAFKRSNLETINNSPKRSRLEEEEASTQEREDENQANGNTSPKNMTSNSNEQAPYVKIKRKVGDGGVTVKISQSSGELEGTIQRSSSNPNRLDNNDAYQPPSADRSPSVSSSDSSDDSAEEVPQNMAHRRNQNQYRTYQEEECYFNFRGQNFSNAMIQNLVTDSAVFGFGRADSESVNYVHIGNSSSNERGFRPNRSNLRILSITGFVSITDSSLQHLAVAAPRLRRIDFSRSGVTAQGVDGFRKIRPECEVVYSGFRDCM